MGVTVVELTSQWQKQDKRKTNTTQEERELLSSIAIARDRNNNGMTRKEMISLIQLMKSCTRVQAQNHFNYLVSHKWFENLKADGKTVVAQATTTKR